MPRCPICQGESRVGSAPFPFCSDRCRLLDLGNWLDGRYVIGGAEEEDAREVAGEDGDGEDGRSGEG